MNEELTIEQLVDRLDALVPEKGAWVEFSLYGGGTDESQMAGNLSGYQRLGIEFLKACREKERQKFYVDLDNLVTPESSINFDLFNLDVGHAESLNSGFFLDRVLPWACACIFILGVSIFGIGLFTIFTWLFL